MTTLLQQLEKTTGRAGRQPLVGGTLCLDFTNTVTGLHEGEHEKEHLQGYEHLIAWALHAGAIGEPEGDLLLKRAHAQGRGAGRALHRALALRDIMHDVFAATAQKREPAATTLTALNEALSEALTHMRVVRVNGGYGWGWDDLSARFEAPLWPVLRSGAELLAGEKLDRVKQCPFPHCGWLFIDLSKNRSRIWCEMTVCGNRAKARRHYLREKRADA